MKKPYKTPRGRIYGAPNRWLVCESEWPITENNGWSVYAPALPHWNTTIYGPRPFTRQFGTPREAFEHLELQLDLCATRLRLFTTKGTPDEAQSS